MYKLWIVIVIVISYYVCVCVCVFLQRERSGMEWNRDDDIKENDNDANIEDDIEDEY